MNDFPCRELVKKIKEAYPAGTRVELVYMDDDHAPPAGTQGTVECVDDIGTVHVAWDNGRRIGVIYGEDTIRRIE